MSDQLQLYNSFSEDDEKSCILCKQSHDDPFELGDKFTYGDITIHLFCALLSANLEQKVDENEEILGFLEDDVTKEAKRASRLPCYYCKHRGASIGCCKKGCKKSFHLSCAIKNDCLVQFVGTFDSFCHSHHGIVAPTPVHDATDVCALCAKAMDVYHPIKSIPLNCCDGGWCHKNCLKNKALSSAADDLVCPKCKNQDDFVLHLLSNGVYIPNGDQNRACTSGASTESGPPAKKKRTHKKWVLSQTFDNADEAKEWLKQEKIWGYHYQNNPKAGLRVSYRCNLVLFRSTQCEASIYLSYDATSDKVYLYRSENPHTHANSVSGVSKMSEEVQLAIRNMFEIDFNIKPLAVLGNLAKNELRLPSKSQLQAFLTKLRNERFGADKINLPVLEKWLQENSVIPIGKNEPFIVDYKVLINEQNPDDSEFRFFVSSNRLLELAINVNKMHTDTTYKLVWQNFPVLLVGTTDAHRHFHMFGIAVCTTETSVDFAFIFNALNKGLEVLFKTKCDPDFVICDAAKAIDNGFIEVYGDGKTKIMCWAHVRRAVVKKLPSFFRCKQTQNEVIHDLDHLQLARTNADFDKAADLFIEKWRAESQEFADYFTNEWLIKNRFWYEGVARNVPSTNNAQEATHKAIKDRHTLRNRFDLGKFREVLYQIVEKYSIEYETGIREYHPKPLIDLPIWTDVYNWAKTNTPIAVTKHRHWVKHAIPVKVIDDSEVSDSLQWESFDNFRKIYFTKCTTTFPTPFNRSAWENGYCDCADFFKKYMCMHVVGIALRMKFVEAPPEAKNIPIGQKRKRGRPALARPAFVIQ